MKFVISSTCQELRSLLSITPTNLEQTYALKNLVANAHQEYNKMFFSTITPSNITIKRQQFQTVGRVRGKKKGMDKKLELSSRKHRNVEHASDIVQHSIPHTIGMEI